MQKGEPSNILAELHMSPDDYNWAATIQGVRTTLFVPPNVLEC